MDHSKQWGKWYGNIVYKQADKRKLGRKEFEKKVAESHSVGMVKMGELLLKEVEDPELRGDIHILLTKAKKSFDDMNPGKLPLASLERTMHIYENKQ